MFDRIMENCTALWLPVSMAYLIFLAGMIAKAIRHFRRVRGAPAYTSGSVDGYRPPPSGAFGSAPHGMAAESRTRDWIPAR
jgi:hypothetical protein